MDYPRPLTCARSKSGRAYVRRAHVFLGTQQPTGMLLPFGLGSIAYCRPEPVFDPEAYQRQAANHFSSPVPLDASSTMDSGITSGDTRPRSTEDCPRRVPCKGLPTYLEEGETVLARRLVVAAGLVRSLGARPKFAGLPCSLASHTAEHREFCESFLENQVLVIGSGQSATESAALLHEACRSRNRSPGASDSTGLGE